MTHDRAREAARSFFQHQRVARRVLATVNLERLFAEFVLECVREALPDQWRARAQVFEDCRPRPGERQDPALDRRCAESAVACRLHAAFLADEDLLDPSHAADVAAYVGADRLMGVA